MPVAEDAIPQLEPRYEVVRELGRGGMGRVLLVRDRYLSRDVALKLLLDPPGGEALEAFRREFALLCEIEHPRIARAFDFGFAEEVPFYTSELIDGSPLGGGGSAEPVRRVLAHARELAEALAFLHRHGILHLDLKPSNVLVPRDPGRGGAVLIDFGLFRRGLREPRGDRIQGSLPTMAPEWFLGGDLGPWTDVYAFGSTLYRVLTGRFPRPLAASSLEAPFDEASWDPAPPAPSRSRAEVPEGLDALLFRCLALDPEARYPSGEDLLAALETIAPEGPARGGMPGGGATRGRASRGASAATVGRDEEIARFDALLEGLERDEGPAAPAGRGPFALLVTGPPGMGQSHLLREMKVRAQTRGVPAYLEVGYAGRPTTPGALLRAVAAHIEDRGARGRWEAFLAGLARPRRTSRDEVSEDERRLRRAAEVSLAAAAVRGPFVLAVDGLQRFDEVSVALLADLARALRERGDARPSVGLVLGYREEGPSAALLGELSDELSRAGTGAVLTLRPLDVGACWALFRARGGEPDLRPLAVHQRTGGVPAGVAALTAAGTGGAAATACSPAALARRRGGAAIEGDARRLLLALDLLGRPATAAEAARIAGLPRRRALRRLEGLAESGLAAEAEGTAGQRAWVAAGGAAGLGRDARPRERRLVHGRIARELERALVAAPDARVVELARHSREAGRRGRALKWSLAAARYLRSTLQSRAALEELHAALDAFPAATFDARVEVALEVSRLEARLGDYERGLEALRDLLRDAEGARGPRRARLILWLATLHGRRGDLGRAARLFAEGLRLGARRGGLKWDEELFFTSELASLKAFAGEHAEALRLCAEGLRRIGRRRGSKARELSLNLLAIRGDVALRSFDHEAAARDLEAAIELSEAIGSPGNQAVLLNNLGIAEAARDRYRDAIERYRAAERLSLRLDEGPSLVSIYGNLAILCSKVGDWPQAEQALASAERLGAASIGRKQAQFLAHARGLSLVYRGRYAAARPHLEEAVRLAEEIGDGFVAAFDGVYLAEAALFAGSYGEARRTLDRLLAGKAPERVRRMARSRMALLEALTGRRPDLDACRLELDGGGAESVGGSGSSGSTAGRAVPFLDAWDGLHAAWALSIALADGAPPAVETALAAGEAFFRKHGASPAAALAAWVLAERAFLRGEVEEARRILETRVRPANDLTAALAPLLEARLEAERARAPRELGACADLLAEAGARMIGNPLPEWDLRLRALRAALGPGDPGGEREVEARRRALAGRLPEEEREAYLESSHWRRWAACPRGTAAAPPRPPPPEPPGREDADGLDSRTALLFRDGLPGPRRRLSASSQAMRELFALLDRIHGSELPVLIEGETGSGKEAVARIIHEESPRAAGPFVVVDCAAVPEGLLEAELFGARAGAFTDLRLDRAGMLAAAVGGTVLIDEVARLPVTAQGKLLRVIAEGKRRPLGAEAEEPVDARFLFSSSAGPEAEVREGRLRRDLFHRISVLRVRVPPLRERPEDIPRLVEEVLAAGEGPPPVLGEGVLDRLASLPWPGNVRELHNLIARLRLERSRRITVEDLERHFPAAAAPPVFPRHLLERGQLPELKASLERDYILVHLERLQGDTTALSRFLGIGRLQLYRRCHRLGIRLRGRKAGKGARP